MPAIPGSLLAAARLAEHEYLLSIPMEPQGFPLNDPGPQALMTSASPEEKPCPAGMGVVAHRGYVGRDGRTGRPCSASGSPRLPDQINRIWRNSPNAVCSMSIRGRARRRCLWYGAVALTSSWTSRRPRPRSTTSWRSSAAGRDEGQCARLAGRAEAGDDTADRRLGEGLTADGLALAPVSALVQAAGAEKGTQ